MADKAPVAVRVTRPYQTEEEFLQNDLDTLTRTTVVLVGAQPRPEGVVLRFEVSLKSGHAILRGEGRVVGTKAHGSEPGLMLRFTRLDSKSKGVVDRASSLREARSAARASIPPPAPAPAPAEPPKAAQPEPEIPKAAPLPVEETPAPVEKSPPPMPHARPLASTGERRAVAPPQDREAVLGRLRARAKTLSPDVVRGILAKRA